MDIDAMQQDGPAVSSHSVTKDKEKERLITASELESVERRRGMSGLVAHTGKRH
jgi:hypothetical protein